MNGVFARNRTRIESDPGMAGGVLCSAQEGTDRRGWVLAAIRELRELSSQRIGVWLETEETEDSLEARPPVFYGQVWDSGGELIPAEWSRLSGESPLPMELLRKEKGVEFRHEMKMTFQTLGPMTDLEYGLWVPIVTQQVVRGVILLGGSARPGPLEEQRARRVAAQIGLLLEHGEKRREIAEHQADLQLWRRVQESLRTGDEPSAIFNELVASCTADGPRGAAAVFAILGERKSHLPVHGPADARGEERLRIRAQSGEDAWVHSVQNGPLENFWRQALESGRVIGAAAERLPLAAKIARIVAIPFFVRGELCGVLLAGLPKRKVSLGILDRLEHRALLAAQVLEHERRAFEITTQQVWRNALLETSAESVVLVDSLGQVAEMSRGARKLTKTEVWPRQSANDRIRFAELFRPKDWEAVHNWLLNSGKNTARQPQDFLDAQRTDGAGLRLSRINLSTPEFYAVRLADRNSQENLRTSEESETELRQTLEWLEEGVVVFDQQGRIRAQNTRFRQMLGLTATEGAESTTNEDLIRRAAKNAVNPDHFAASWKRLARAEAAEFHDEVSMAWPVPQVIERYTRPILTKEGDRLGRVEVYREMAAHRAFQERMLRTEKLVAMGQRVLGIVHELSNPLTTILGTAQRMVAGGDTERYGREAHRILEESQRATTILRQLLQLTRESREERKLFSLNELVARTVDLLHSTMNAAGIRLRVEEATGLPRVEGDFGQLQQVLLNLLQNAQQAMGQAANGTTITVRTRLGSPGRVRLEVADEGPGIPETIQSRIFDPFFTTKPAGVGTGLGLAIVLGFVRQHGGTVNLRNPAAGGAEFVIELPAAEVSRERVASLGQSETRNEFHGPVPHAIAAGPSRREFSADPEGLPVGLRTGGRLERVLVVEDEPTVANLIGDVLRDEGMQVDVLTDAESALQKSIGVFYDLVICDLHMPGMDGQRFYNALQQRQDSLQERLLFVTGDVLSPRTQEFLERHHLPHVAKPFLVEELLTGVRETLRAMKHVALARKGAVIDHVAGDR